ncbi:MAG TPA: hypothetical protein VKV17_02485 [Bryobacteraceae bacterium]|nr:hypothetical protein [Bryobacteraceae bacterium]
MPCPYPLSAPGIIRCRLPRRIRKPARWGWSRTGRAHARNRHASARRGSADFRLHKPTTIRRRIARRMLLRPFHSMGEYAIFLQTNRKELRALLQDTLIDVPKIWMGGSAGWPAA